MRTEISYQIRHKEMGIYQGNCMGLGFWHPISGMPEQGFAEFPTKEEAKDYITFLTTEAESLLNSEDLSIEPYDRKLSEAMHQLYELEKKSKPN